MTSQTRTLHSITDMYPLIGNYLKSGLTQQ